MCPFNLSILNEPGVLGLPNGPAGTAATGAGAGAVFPINLFQVPSPTIPSATKPFLACHAFTAASVAGPKLPTGSTPNLLCNNLTFSLLSPFLNNIFILF